MEAGSRRGEERWCMEPVWSATWRRDERGELADRAMRTLESIWRWPRPRRRRDVEEVGDEGQRGGGGPEGGGEVKDVEGGRKSSRAGSGNHGGGERRATP
ncbi:hypothetical protein HPP92_013190 [Vanilla planifolia]|uniref:Uncharacterized protein n=1 Tax=Vanilla planifolia TaxID=51239 RepID=A0A835QWK5_VANPL|nr:hypothetical protein HPP92_013190 [Vanilla planifolia]